MDGDTGRSPIEFEFLVRRLEPMGVSAVIIEDKVFPKRNSLDISANQTLEDSGLFAQKIQRGKGQVLTDEFMIIARLESLIAGTGLEDAIARAETYIIAGVDAVMIHSQQKEPDEILAFADAYQSLCQRLGVRPPLVCVPTTYNRITDVELSDRGFNIMIHANHLLRASYKAMEEAASSILNHDRSQEVEAICTPTSTIFEVVGFDKVTAQDRLYDSLQRFSIIIPAAGKDVVFDELPKSMINVGGQTILDHQVERLKKAGLTNNKVVVVRGHEGGQFTRTDIEYRDNDSFLETNSAHSLFCAESAMSDGFLLIYSDILFDEVLVQRLLEITGDIILLLDKSYRYHTHDVDKRPDLAIANRRDSSNLRSLTVDSLLDISRIGKHLRICGDGPFLTERGGNSRQYPPKLQNPQPLPFSRGFQLQSGLVHRHYLRNDRRRTSDQRSRSFHGMDRDPSADRCGEGRTGAGDYPKSPAPSCKRVGDAPVTLSQRFFNPTDVRWCDWRQVRTFLPPPPQKVLIALTRSSLSTAEEIQNDILSDYQVDLLPIIAHEPSVSSVQEVTNDVMLGAPDWIIAIGGGSVMDAAKAAAIIATNGGNVEGHLRGTQTIEHQGIPLIAIPTTSGLGSEVTPYASITDTQEKRKISFSHDYLFPKFALLDPSLTLTPRQTAISEMDALSHAIEGYWSKRATPATDALALGASRLVFDQLARLKNSPKDLAARRLAMEGSMLAGLTISNAQTTAVHAVSYPITVFYGVPHGLTCYLLLPAMIRFNSGAIAADKERRLLENLGVDSMVHMAESVECLQSQLELPSRLADVGIENGYWPDRLANNPKAISGAQLATMLEGRI